MRHLHVIIKNQSGTNANACIILKGIEVPYTPPTAQTLIWASVALPGNTGNADLGWDETLQFATASTASGNHYDMNMIMNANPGDMTTVSYNGQLSLSAPRRDRPNAFMMQTEMSIPRDVRNLTFGVAVDRKLGFANQDLVRPSMNYNFEVRPEYYICTVANGNVGDVLPGNVQLTKIEFPAAGGTMYATLGANNAWKVSASAQ